MMIDHSSHKTATIREATQEKVADEGSIGEDAKHQEGRVKGLPFDRF
jgi:hypothetical protein